MTFYRLKDYYEKKLPNPMEDQGQVVYNCFEGQNNIILPLSKKEIILRDVNINMADAEEWFNSDIGNINDYEGISL